MRASEPGSEGGVQGKEQGLSLTLAVMPMAPWQRLNAHLVSFIRDGPP